MVASVRRPVSPVESLGAPGKRLVPCVERMAAIHECQHAFVELVPATTKRLVELMEAHDPEKAAHRVSAPRPHGPVQSGGAVLILQMEVGAVFEQATESLRLAFRIPPRFSAGAVSETGQLSQHCSRLQALECGCP